MPRRFGAAALLIWTAAAFTAVRERPVPSFENFVRERRRAYKANSVEYLARQEHFLRHVAAVEEHNHQAGRSWTAGVNGLADRSDEELQGLRGYARGAAPKTHRAVASLLSKTSSRVDPSHRPSNFSWYGALEAVDKVVDQDRCGSCWAVAASTILRAHSEIFFRDRTFSTQQLLACTPNPRHCGGEGGCRGATVGLALEYAADAGVVPESGYHYDVNGGDLEACPEELRSEDPSARLLNRGASIGLRDFKKLTPNKLSATYDAILTGPIGIAVCAGREWNIYKGGVLDTCAPDCVINHAVVLIGYGAAERKYWHIQNSWGTDFGEDGYVRLLRMEDALEEAHCGWDTAPQEGNGCDGGPDKVWICGSCGILFDSYIPVFEPAEGSLYSQAGGDPERVVSAQLYKRGGRPEPRSLVVKRKWF